MSKGAGLLLPGLQASVYLLTHEAEVLDRMHGKGEPRAIAYRLAAELISEQTLRMRSIHRTGRAGGEHEANTAECPQGNPPV